MALNKWVTGIQALLIGVINPFTTLGPRFYHTNFLRTGRAASSSQDDKRICDEVTEALPESKRVDLGKIVERFVWKSEMRIHYLMLGNVFFFNPEMHIIYFNVWMNRCLAFDLFSVEAHM